MLKAVLMGKWSEYLLSLAVNFHKGLEADWSTLTHSSDIFKSLMLPTSSLGCAAHYATR